MKFTGNVKELTVTQTALSRALGLTPARVNQLIDLEIVIRDEKDTSGGVFLFDSVKNYYQSKQTGDEKGDANFWVEKGKHEKVKRQIAELKLAREEGKLYEASTVERVMTEQLVALRTHLLGLGAKLAARLEGKSKSEIASAIDAEVEERLEEMSEYKSELFADE